MSHNQEIRLLSTWVYLWGMKKKLYFKERYIGLGCESSQREKFESTTTIRTTKAHSKSAEIKSISNSHSF
jgi:hypothetical protein